MNCKYCECSITEPHKESCLTKTENHHPVWINSGEPVERVRKMTHLFEQYKCTVCGTRESILTQNQECSGNPVEQQPDIFDTLFKGEQK